MEKIPFIKITLYILFIIPTFAALYHGAPWVPTPMKSARKMLELAKIKPGEKVYDLGCGDGRLVHLAAQEYQAKAVGFELSPAIYLIAKIRQLFWHSKAKILLRDWRLTNLSDADVIVCYLLKDTLKFYQKKLEKELKPGCRVISYAFNIGDWNASHQEPKNAQENLCAIWVYEMQKAPSPQPARQR